MLLRRPGHFGARKSHAKLEGEPLAKAGLALLPRIALQELQESHATFHPQDFGFAHGFRACFVRGKEDSGDMRSGKYLIK